MSHKKLWLVVKINMHYGSVKEVHKKSHVLDGNCFYEAFCTKDLIDYLVALLEYLSTQSI